MGEGHPTATGADINLFQRRLAGIRRSLVALLAAVLGLLPGLRSARADDPACRATAGTRLAPLARSPIRHVLIVMQENRSFDHYLGKLASQGQPEAEGFPASYVNVDRDGRRVHPYHLPSTCLPADPPHQWGPVHAHWNGGKMDGFLKASSTGGERDHDDNDQEDDEARFPLGYYDGRDLPFYYWLASTFAVGDRYFASVLGGTWPNRQFLYTATAQSTHASTGQLLGARTIFDSLRGAGVSWQVYTDGPPRQDCIGWAPGARGVAPLSQLRAALKDPREAALPAVAFIDAGSEDEHPPADAQRGEAWMRQLINDVIHSAAWGTTALFFAYDEGGGLFDHVAPPPACVPSPDRAEFDRLGVRVPFIVVSPWVKRHHVSHVTYDHTSLLRFIELTFGLPALTARDANADPLLDFFDFGAPSLMQPPPLVAAGKGGCRPRAWARR